MPMRDIIKNEPQKVETIDDADKKFQSWDSRIFGDRRDEELHKQSVVGKIEEVRNEVHFVSELKKKANQVLTWVLAAAFGALGLWLFNRLMMGG